MKKWIITLLTMASLSGFSQESPKEEDYYKIITLPVPEGILLEIGGVTMLPNGSLAVATRRGDVWVIENPTSRQPYFRKFASGLHEVLGLVYQNGAFYCAQRGELTKLMDTNGDGKADLYETVYAWPISGHYHEYSFGPKIAPDGSFFVSGNVAFGNEEWWRGESRVPTRGWIFRITPEGVLKPYATGMRSPAGLGMIDGDLFYTDNQGDWMGSGGVWHIKEGSFTGHPAGLKWAKGSPVKFTEADFFKFRDNRQVKQANGTYIKPENVVNEKPEFLYELKDKLPGLQTPAVWLPHGILGISNSEILKDETQGDFGPFAGQLFVGDQGQSKIMRVFLEKINGEYQGAAFDFRAGFQSGVLRMAFAKDGSLFVGETNRGWGSAGDANQGLQRLVWNGKLPFEMMAVRAMPDGFELEFTMPIDPASAEKLDSYEINSFLYKHFPVYGSPPVNRETLKIKGVQVSADRKKVRLVVDGLRPYYVHELNVEGIRSAENSWSLVHPTAYYTLNAIPSGEKLPISALKGQPAKAATSTKSAVAAAKPTVSPDGKGKPSAAPAPAVASAAPTWAEIRPLMQKHTCLACHASDKRVVGPAFKDIAKRNYSNDKIVDLIYNPQPQNWPDYATPMAAMPQVPRPDALKMAQYINSLR